MNPLNKLLDMYYNLKACAVALGIKQARLSNWKSHGYIPYNNADLVETKTDGKIKAQSIKDWAIKIKKEKKVTQ